jgi:hypothetical protein
MEEAAAWASMGVRLGLLLAYVSKAALHKYRPWSVSCSSLVCCLVWEVQPHPGMQTPLLPVQCVAQQTSAMCTIVCDICLTATNIARRVCMSAGRPTLMCSDQCRSTLRQ